MNNVMGVREADTLPIGFRIDLSLGIYESLEYVSDEGFEVDLSTGTYEDGST